MSMQIVVDGHHVVGQPTTVQAPAPAGPFSAVFTDDGETGYFFALDMTAEDNKVRDGLHVYNVSGVADNDKVAHLHIGWSDDARKVVLLINGVPQAVFDFDAQRGYCQTGYPPPAADGAWPQETHAWSEDTAKLFA
jgi:hypothetical protein